MPSRQVRCQSEALKEATYFLALNCAVDGRASTGAFAPAQRLLAMRKIFVNSMRGVNAWATIIGHRFALQRSFLTVPCSSDVVAGGFWLKQNSSHPGGTLVALRHLPTRSIANTPAQQC